MSTMGGTVDIYPNTSIMPYCADSQLSNSMKYVVNDYLATRAGKKLVIEAEYCQAVRFALHRGKDPKDYTVLNCDAQVIENARALGADGHAGWTADVLPTLPDASYETVYMDYCCTPNGNPNCRPYDEMPEVWRVLKDTGVAIFTFAKRGVNGAVEAADDMLKAQGFHILHHHEYRLARSQPMFVIFCTKFIDFEKTLAKHQAHDVEEMEGDTRRAIVEQVDTTRPVVTSDMTFCDAYGCWFPDGGTFFHGPGVKASAQAVYETQSSNPFTPGQKIRVRYNDKKWYAATVVMTDACNVHITYDGYDEKDVIHCASDRIRLPNARRVTIHDRVIGIDIDATCTVTATENPKISVGERILRVEGIDVSSMDHRTFCKVVGQLSRPVVLTLAPSAKPASTRSRAAKRAWQTIRRKDNMDTWIANCIRDKRTLDFDVYRKFARDKDTSENQWDKAVAAIRRAMEAGDDSGLSRRRSKRIRSS